MSWRRTPYLILWIAPLLFWGSLTGIASAADEIHWTIKGQTAVTFDWRGSETTISYGETTAYGATVTAVTPSIVPFSSAGPFWEAALTGLTQDTIYHYSIGGGPDHTFRTPPPAGSSGFTIWVEGDISETTSSSKVAPIQSMIAGGSPAFVLMLGDLTYASSHGITKCDQHFNDMMVWSQDAAYMPAWGNREWETPAVDDLRNYKGRFDLPNQQTSPGSPTAGGEDWSWFDYGNVRFVAYPEPWSGAWADWNTKAIAIMDAAQADPNITFIVTYGHRPAYSSGHNTGSSTLKGYLDALGASHSKYVMNLCAHSKDYERSFPQSGVTHVVVGTGGSGLDQDSTCLWLTCIQPSWSAYRAMHLGPLRLTFSETGIQGDFFCGPSGGGTNNPVCTSGTIIDTFNIGITTPPPAPVDEVHWTFKGQTAVTFDWRGSQNTISYGETTAYGTTVTAVAPSITPISSAGPFWEAALTGLTENTLYHYSIGGGPDHTFRTPPPAGSSSFTIFAEGDIGETSSYSRMGAIQSIIAGGAPSFVLMVGDLSYANIHGPAGCDQHFNDVMTWSRDAAYMPAWGNHEWEGPTNDDLRNYKGRFDLPNQQTSPGSPAVSCCGEDWSWFDYGNVRFIAYPEPWSEAWADWNTKAIAIMDAAQADPNITFIVTYGHRPAYSSGHNTGSATLKGYLDALGASHSKYVLNLNGHSHDYERSYPQNGVTHLTVGTGGSPLEQDSTCLWLTCIQPSWSAYRAMHLGALRLQFTTTGIQGDFICGPAGSGTNDVTCTQGSIMDTFSIGTTPPPPAPIDEVHWTIKSQTAVTFDWRGSQNTISYGTTTAYGQTRTAVTPSILPFSSAGPFWEAALTGLTENTLYHYSISGEPDHTFRTPPPHGGSGFTVFAEGDIGDGAAYSRMPIVQSLIAGGTPAFVLAVGDLSYANDHGVTACDGHFNDVMVWSRDAAYMPAWGNHEWETPTIDDLRNYKGRFDLPNQQTSPGSPTAGGEDWSWFDYGNVRFIAYPEPWSGAWSDWNTKAGPIMDAAQADPNIRYIVTYGHRPAYSSGHNTGSGTLKGYLDGLGASHSKYVLNLNGHSHDYERSYPQNGVTHLTIGTGGSGMEQDGACLWLTCIQPSWSAYRAMHQGTLRLTFSDTGIQGDFLCGPAGGGTNDVTCTQGSVMDTFSIGFPGQADTVAPATTVDLRKTP